MSSSTSKDQSDKMIPDPDFIRPIPIVMRAHNDMPIIRETLEMVARQDTPFTLYAFDNASTDGTRELLLEYTDKIFDVPAGSYIPGEVLNRAMMTVDPDAPYVVFLNSDCTPLNERWLRELVAGFVDDTIGAVFGRQLPRPGCTPLLAKDTEDTFGDGSRQRYWRHCFSMASSAIRRRCWEESPFDPAIQYSEDIDWTWRLRQRGSLIQYVKDSQVYHSHNYTLKQFRKRHYGEGKAEASIFTWSPWDQNLLRYSLLPYLRQVASDISYALRQRQFASILHSPLLRGAQMVGRRKGFRDGIRALQEQKQTKEQKGAHR